MIRTFKDAAAALDYERVASDYDNLTEAYSFVFGCKAHGHVAVCNSIDEMRSKVEELMSSCLTEGARALALKIVEEGEAANLSEAVECLSWFGRIPGYLVEAYFGAYDVELAALETDTEKQYFVFKKMNNSTPTDVLDTYLKWNGIIGYTNQVLGVQAFMESRANV